MGFRSVAIEKKSKEISQLLVRFQKDFDIFSGYLAKLKTNMDTVQKTLDNAQNKSDKINEKLKQVTKIDMDDNKGLLDGFAGVQEMTEIASGFMEE